MFENEILEIVGDAADNGERLNAIADQFRHGRDLTDLVVLLDSGNSELVSIAAWILGELHLELYNSAGFISRLRELVDHEDPSVRFHALGALYPALDPQDVATQTLLSTLRSDPNEGVRKSAETAAARLFLN